MQITVNEYKLNAIVLRTYVAKIQRYIIIALRRYYFKNLTNVCEIPWQIHIMTFHHLYISCFAKKWNTCNIHIMKNHSHIFKHFSVNHLGSSLVVNQRTTPVNATVLEVESHTYSHESYIDRIRFSGCVTQMDG